MDEIRRIKASGDQKHLAVLSLGEGHSVVEVIDLPALLTDKQTEVLGSSSP